ncbi:MAG: hypothetical protein CVU71_10220 [Deltaproteobacteria bacterium HGW-Deltaproteobacteria-6]|jgi:hypothetical protein|nr:MAG: hypothetical protein CVU71_10220 [Deltaproteobacteria bacterium HGW-Deltaproteobacteria-6]
MLTMKSVLRNLTVGNGFLFAAAVSSAYLIVLPFMNMDIRVPALRLNQAILSNNTQKTEWINPSPADYALIAEQNLFHPERKIPPEKTAEKAVPRPEVVLYGTLIFNDVSVAYIEDKKAPKTTPGRGKRQIAAEKGYNMNGYILQQINPDSIVFVKGDDRMMVRLEDGEKRRDTEMAKTSMTAAGAAGQAGPQHAASAAPAGLQQAAPAAAHPAAHPTAQPPQTPATAATSGQSNAGQTPFGVTGRRNAAQIQVQKRREAALQMRQSQTP